MKVLNFATTLALTATLLAGSCARADEKTEQTVAFRHGDNYVTAIAGTLNTSRNEIGDGQTFVIIDLNGGEIADGDSIQIKWAPPKARPTLWREDEGVVRRVGTKADAACTFKVKVKSEKDAPLSIALQTASGKFVAVTNRTAPLATADAEDKAANFALVKVPKPEGGAAVASTTPTAPIAATASIAAASTPAVASLKDAKVTPASSFTDHMVLQQGADTPVWGTAAPGERVSVALAGQTREAVATNDGKWMIHLQNLKAGGPHTLTIRGNITVQLKDVYIGEVWLASGQSNMDFTVAKTAKYYFAGVANEEQEVAAANYPQIRMFKGDWTMAYTPQSTAPGSWKVCTPENVREFSAVGYFFARALHKELGVPVGVITQTYGASTAEAWVRREALQAAPETKALLDAFDAKVGAFTSEEKRKYEEARAAWQIESDKATAAGTKAPRAPKNPDPVQDQHNPTVLYNGMIAGLVLYGIKGVLWYQGESVTGGNEGVKLYPKLQETLVRDWRTLWNQPDLPFYNDQLAGYEKTNPKMRAAQATILTLPHTGMAVAIDVGDRTDVHPKNKQDVGERLARIALANAYGRDIEYSGPVYQAMEVEGNAVRVRFSHLGGGLVAKGSEIGELKTFEIAGSDGKFVPATAKIDGETVVVSSPDVPSPVVVRYAWQNYPEDPNFFNKAGLPAAPFQTALKTP
jgi:sialate O-acetylesterase